MSYVVSAIVKTDFMDLKNETYAHRKKKTQMVSNKSFTDIFFKKVNLEYMIGRANKFVKWNVTYST